MKGRGGLSWRRRGRRHRALASLILALAASPALAREPAPQPIPIEAGTLPGAIAAIARAGGVEIVSLEPRLGLVPVRARTLPADPAAALQTVLRGTGYRAVRIGPRSFRVEAIAPRRAGARAARRQAMTSGDITVIAGKFPTPIADYPGSLVRVPAEGGAALPETAQLADLARQSPLVFATAFGDGRDKFFIRGIADSSFNGASQPTTAIYFDDAPLSFGSPNPNLRLYDIASIEVLEGPQGTLFGAGSLGGAIRVTPNPVDLARIGGMATAETSAYSGGGPGWKLGGAVNLPLAPGKAGLRLVGFDEREGGYIDDPAIGSNINRIDVAGGRAAFALDLASGLRVDLSGLYQRTKAADSQYADQTGPLMRSAAIAQPFRSELALGRLALRKRWDNGMKLATVLSVGHRSSLDRFDATADAMAIGATVYDLQRSSSVLTGETRLSRNVPNGLSWVVGLNLQQITDGQSRAFGSPDGTPALDEVTNQTRSASVFVQGRAPLGPRMEATLGLRYTVARTDSEPARGAIVSFVRGETAPHFDPTVALLWRANHRLSVFARYQSGYRNGGVTVARGVGRVSDFKPDSLAMGEAGLRLLRLNAHGLEASAALSYARWNNVLAELVTRRGTPITENIGDARLLAIEGNANWLSPTGWRLGGALLYAVNSLDGDLAGQTPQPNRRLPDAPSLSARIEGGYEWRGARGLIWAVSASGRYVGRSVLGPGPSLDLSQGNYGVLDLRATARRGPLNLWLAIDNALNNHSGQFALGNPLLLYRREGFAPLAPRRFSTGFSLAY